MTKVKFYELGAVDDALLKYAVIVCRYGDKWIYCKHEKRDTWEVPGGHREDGEDILQTAKRELFEETGAVEFDLEPICAYSFDSYGLLCYASVHRLGELPHSEIERIGFFNDEPEALTYPEIQPKLLKKVREVKEI